MARFVMANRHAGKAVAEKVASRESMSDVLAGSFMTGTSVVGRHEPEDAAARHLVLFEAEPDEVAARAGELPHDVIVEREIHHHVGPFGHSPPPKPPSRESATAADLREPSDDGEPTELTVRVVSSPDGEALDGAEVNLFFNGFGFRRKVTAVTDGEGRAVLRFGGDLEPSAVVAMPAGGRWPMAVMKPAGDALVSCPPLPDSDSHLGWWHRRVGVPVFREDLGRGIGVGVIDTGVGPHPALDHVESVGAFIDGAYDATGGRDAQMHGSHICGIIGGRPVRPGDYGGIAPGASLYSARIFPPQGTATQLGIAHAMDRLSGREGVDLINVSLGSDEGSEIAHDAIKHAIERGTLCICAAGNTAGDVLYPGAFPETVAVSALGMVGWGPPGSVPAMREPRDKTRFGDDDLFLDIFSCHGRGVGSAAPGVGIVSTVPARFGLAAPYVAMGGTSMAAAVVCAALAVLLSRSREYAALPRNRARVEMARAILGHSCRSVGLDAGLQGLGVPRV